MLSALSQQYNMPNLSASSGLAPESSISLAAREKFAAGSLPAEQISNVQTLPGQDSTNPDGSPRDAVELSNEAQEIRELQLRDQEVRNHEAAHAAAGGAYAGSPSYTFERGADGQTYAVNGSVSIDLSPVSGDPEATFQKAQQVRAAALAPAQPSSQDMRVAQKAQAMAAAAQRDISQQLSDNLKSMQPDSTTSNPLSNALGQDADNAGSDSSNYSNSGFVNLDFYA